MANACVTIIAPLGLDRVPDAEGIIDALGNPAKADIAAALDRLDRRDNTQGTHFASLHAIRSQDGERAYLAFEFSADGTDDEALARIVGAMGERIRPVFMHAGDWRDGGDLLAYLRDHRVAVGCGWFSNPGVVFAGTPGMSVGRIREEAKLGAHVAGLLSSQPGHLTALERIEAVRDQLAGEPEFAPALKPGTPEPPFEPPSIAGLVVQLAGSFVKTYLWPVAPVLLAWALYAGWRDAIPVHGVWRWIAAFTVGALGGLWNAFWIALLLLVIVAVVVYVLLRKAEARDSLEERAPDRTTLAGIFERENRCAQNHMISVTQRKPGAVRWFTARLVFWVVGEFAATFYRPGFLSDIGSIHFARWVTAPDSGDLLFFSNYDSSWESYLEDFITRAHAGLTAVWSNSIGFPRSENLFQQGATDGERFKRYARHSMIPTRFWYRAYPSLTTTIIRTNAEIRRGLSGTMTEDEGTRWLALFGSATRPVSNLVSTEIQSLIFGGLGFMPFGTCLLFELPADIRRAKEWLAAVNPHIAFNDGRRLKATAVVTFALGARGLARLGLPAESLETFPFAFLEGITNEPRARILGDLDDNAAEHWRWGKTQPDAVLLVYGRSQQAVDDLERALVDSATKAGMAEPYRIPLKKITDDKTEPFGYVDGISQPVIRGTYKGLRNADPIHLVEPGEFILGYPDNRGNLPPGPTLSAIADPANRLPLLGARDDFAQTVVENDRDVGRNGSFLVIRELEQDATGFSKYCKTEAKRLAGRLPPPYEITADFIAAKLVGRWKDGSSLVRHPYYPRDEEKRRYDAHETIRPKTNPVSQAAAVDRPPNVHSTSASGADRPPKPSRLADNDFLFGTEDPEALRCPFGAHVRRANPRDSLDPGSADQIAITNRHRVLRVGRQYTPQDGKNPGLLFMCLNGDIERQFEFVQQTWLKSPSFHGLSCEKDPLLGDAEIGACGFTIPSRDGPLRLAPMPRFITTKGGGYFFLPGKRLIDYLGATA